MGPLMMQSSNKVQSKLCTGLGWCQLEAPDEWDFCLGGLTGLVLSSRCTPPGFPRLSREEQVETRQSEKQRSAPGNKSDSVVR